MDEAQTKGKVVTVKHEVKLQLHENDVMTALKGEERLLRDFSQDQWKTKWTSISTLDISGKRAIEFLPPLHLPRGSGVQRKSKRDGKQFEAVFKDQQIVEVKVPKDCLPDLRDAVKTRLLHPLEKGEDGQGDLPFSLVTLFQKHDRIKSVYDSRTFQQHETYDQQELEACFERFRLDHMAYATFEVVKMMYSEPEDAEERGQVVHEYESGVHVGVECSQRRRRWISMRKSSRNSGISGSTKM